MEMKTRTAIEAIADIRAMLYQRYRAAESAYDQAQRDFPVGSAELREARAVQQEAQIAYSTVKAIAETATSPITF